MGASQSTGKEVAARETSRSKRPKGLLETRGIEESKKQAEEAAERKTDYGRIASGMSTDVATLADKLESHVRGKTFKYAIVGNTPSLERSNMFNKLRRVYNSPDVSRTTLDSIPPVRLVKDRVSLSLTEVMDNFKGQKLPSYCAIDCVLINYVPLQSYIGEQNVLSIGLQDMRLDSDQTVRAIPVTNKMGYNILMMTDYYFETKDVGDMVLTFSCPSTGMKEGKAWGAARVVIELSFKAFPNRLPLQESQAVLVLSDTDLDNFQCDPRFLDMVLTPEARTQLRSAYLRGEVEDVNKPRDDSKGMATARTIFGSSPGNMPTESLMESMKAMAFMKAAEEDPGLKSAMKPSTKYIEQSPQGKDAPASTSSASTEEISRTSHNPKASIERVGHAKGSPPPSRSTNLSPTIEEGDDDSVLEKVRAQEMREFRSNSLFQEELSPDDSASVLSAQKATMKGKGKGVAFGKVTGIEG